MAKMEAARLKRLIGTPQYREAADELKPVEIA
jgi:hypothetical protein